jgi:DNA-binding transcriptional MocR family regulator
MTHNWYAVITAKVLMAKDISSTQKLLVALISNLSNDRGYCFASNKYLAECLDINPVTISKNITDLEEKGYISRIVKINPLTKQVEERVLILVEHPNTIGMVENAKTSRRKCKPLPSKKDTPPVENDNTPPIEKAKDNNKVLKTNIITNIKTNIKDLDTKKDYDPFDDDSWIGLTPIK